MTNFLIGFFVGITIGFVLHDMFAVIHEVYKKRRTLSKFKKQVKENEEAIEKIKLLKAEDYINPTCKACGHMNQEICNDCSFM
jgi:hypothetical protein